ncbi:L,D-transpeptidase family protein [Microbacterium sp. GXS0129]|uniref:L,D-transpeptidase family protein n=1 Tax=Microbacterium sp. GXS0129 TaxID=3377836 RepID=UPI00383AD939
MTDHDQPEHTTSGDDATAADATVGENAATAASGADTAAADGDAAEPVAVETVAAPVAAEPTLTALPQAADTPVAVWVDAEPKKRRRRWPWVFLPAAGVAAGLVIASTTLIAPGVSASGVPIGGLTPTAAANAITDRLASTTIELTGDGEKVTLSAADLGATIDAGALADAAHRDAPLWKLDAWNSAADTGAVTIDEDKAEAALRAALPDAFVAATDAEVTFADGSYHVKPAADGSGIDVDGLRAALQSALENGKAVAQASAKPETLTPAVSTEAAQAAADKLNGLVSTIGFYVGDERTVPVDAATAASWLKPTIDDSGALTIEVDEAALAKVLPTLAEKVDRAAVNGTEIVNKWGDLVEEGEPSRTGRKLGDTSKLAAAFAQQVAAGDGKLVLPVEETQPEITKVERHIEVNLSEQRTYVYENGKAIRTFSISSGAAGHETHTGEFTIFAHVPMQDMGCVDGYDYCTKDVPTVMYFNGDEAFHGTYWHNNFGTPMSHGCINMREDEALWLYNWAADGVSVSVHY